MAATVGALREEYEGKMQAAQEELEARMGVRQTTTKQSLNPTDVASSNRFTKSGAVGQGGR